MLDISLTFWSVAAFSSGSAVVVATVVTGGVLFCGFEDCGVSVSQPVIPASIAAESSAAAILVFLIKMEPPYFVLSAVNDFTANTFISAYPL